MMKKRSFVVGMYLSGCVVALHPARAMISPQPINIDGGPLGALQLSGGADGIGYYLTGTGDKAACNLDIYCPAGDKSVGTELANYYFSIQKTSGEIQFTINVAGTGGVVLGTEPYPASTNYITPLFESYVSIVPNSQLTLSAGQIPSLEGYESQPDWVNSNMLNSLLYDTENAVDRGVMAAYTNKSGTVNATVSFSDGYRTGVFNYLQVLAGYNFTEFDSSSVSVDAYTGINLGRSGLNTVGAYGPTSEYAALYNSNMVGAYIGGYSLGNLSLVPEVQFQWVNADAQLGIPKESQNLGLLLLTDYTFGKSPYSIGGFAEYAVTHGSSTTWFIGPNAAAVGVSVAPTWQRQNLFARFNAGYLYLTNNKADGVSYGYGSNNEGKGQFTGVLEAGVTF